MDSQKLRIVLPGGSGQVGHLLAQHFHAQGHAVTVFSRSPRPVPWRVVAWDGSAGSASQSSSWINELERADVCINLSGRSVNCRYNAANRREIYDSRICTTRRLNEVIAAMPNPPRLWLNMSTATIYRHDLDRPMDEATGELGGNEPGAPASWNFSIGVGRDWEDAFFSASTPRTRKIAMRSAIVLSPGRGGIFEALLNLVRWGLGGKVGTGRQFVSWIHGEDFVRTVDWLIAHEDLSGVVNLASPNPLPNQDFMRAFREAWGARIGLPASGPVLELGCFLMRTESELVLKNRRAVPGRLLESGFKFLFPEWPDAVRDLVARWKKEGQ
ncbi:MAG: TIGR01777 family oxidoreductase [Acidobacteriaceae bacterium]